MSEPTNPSPDAIESEQAGTDAPAEAGHDDGGAALDRADDAIREARDAEGSVAANDDITTQDDARAGAYSEDPDGTGGQP